MKIKYLLLLMVLLALLFSLASAEDGDLFRRNISKTPGEETEKAAIYMMDFYVPAQASTGLVGPVDNYLLADELTKGYEARDYAKPLVTVWIDDMAENEGEGTGGSIDGGIVFGEFDAFSGVSLDDGTSWKVANLSRSADLSSFNLANGTAYPGHVHNVVHQVFGDNIFVAWVSKYCDGGTPLYTMDPVTDTAYLEDLKLNRGKNNIYLYDLFGVAGSQDSVDYTEQGFPEVGEIPYSCVWTARGKLLAGDDLATTDVTEASYVMWAKPERLTSGRRDANLPAVDCAGSAGCILTWQEDPQGLRPGQGLGPGEGWSGAVANQQTDIWYSYISQADFDLVFDAVGTIGAPITMTVYAEDGYTTMPKVYVPMAMPVRLTDNAMCKAVNTDVNPSFPYCYVDFDTVDNLDPSELPEAPEEGSEFCATSESWTNPGGTTLNICVTEDNRLLNGRVASTRVRLNLKPYTTADGITSAWVVMAAEESKALGVPGEDVDPVDIGKDMWYYSFDMAAPYTPGENLHLVEQGGLLNQPAVCKDETDEFCTSGVGQFYDIQYDVRESGEYPYYLTEIARRFALTTNSVSAAADSGSGLSAMLIYKQGIINQGGPADIFLRRVILPAEFDPTIDNPYAYENMQCENADGSSGWVYAEDADGDGFGDNPNYLKGICLAPAINISGATIVDCGDAGGDNDSCAAAFPVEDDGSCPDCTPANFPKVYEWRQCDGTDAITGCEADSDLDDQSWENPYDVAKGHRGFLDGDVVMIMYAWAPNWNSNAVGNDHYNLYVRRSFDGGLTWTTTPSDLGGIGVIATEYYYGGSIGDPVPVEWTYAAGDFEQARNVSMLTGNQITILDPRYTPSGGLKLYPTIRTNWLTDNGLELSQTLPYTDDIERDPAAFFVIYETGDNTTVAEGEAVPLDLFYSRATFYGDEYEVMEYYKDKDGDGIAEMYKEWPWLENKKDDLSGEAGVVANPGGTFMYTVWNQWKEEITDDGHELIYDSDIIFRRLLYTSGGGIEDYPPVGGILYVPPAVGYNLGGDAVFAGTARDLDHNGAGIVTYSWTSSIDGEICTENLCTMPVTDLSTGLHTITFTAQDDESNWSRAKTVRLLVAEQLHRTFAPVIVR